MFFFRQSFDEGSMNIRESHGIPIGKKFFTRCLFAEYSTSEARHPEMRNVLNGIKSDKEAALAKNLNLTDTNAKRLQDILTFKNEKKTKCRPENATIPFFSYLCTSILKHIENQ